MPNQNQTTTPDTEKTFVCDCGYLARSACQGEPFFKEHEGERFCVLHYPDKDKLEFFRAALKRKLDAKDFNFLGVWFPEEVSFEKVEFSADANFFGATFSAKADFSGATFSAEANFFFSTFSADANFSGAAFSAKANFSDATFSGEADFSGATFSTKAIFSGATFSADANFSNAMFSASADFSYAMFSAAANFRDATFSASADFSSATFSEYADFSSATFSAEAGFWGATFSAEAGFWGATFSTDAGFGNATFSAEAGFNSATFSAEAGFWNATFSADADFSSATFKSYIRFAGDKDKRSIGQAPRLDFQFAPIEKPERVSFHTLGLKPHWFINCDCRKFEFTDCEWNHNLKQELEGATEAKISAPHRLLAITFRQLADNAEANHRYHEASNFRYNAFEARRIEKFWGFVPWRLDWWYWLASGYGERVGRAFVVFVALFALFAFGYGRSGFDQSGKGTAASVTQGATIQPDTVGKPLGWKEAFVYSFNVSILQKPEPKPLTLTAKILVSLETVLGPAQAALLALAVRRRFMR